MKNLFTLSLVSAALMTGAVIAAENAPAELKATASLQNAEGVKLAEATLKDAPSGVLINVAFKGVTEGVHAFHIHQKGECTPPDFVSAGGHFNPQNRKHGMMASDGAHGGDMPNVHVPASGEMNVEIFVRGVTLQKGVVNSLFDEDGAALVLHQGADDYTSDPAGNAGGRLACGVVMLP